MRTQQNDIDKMNNMYRLPVAQQPTLELSVYAGKDQPRAPEVVTKRLANFKKTLLKEVDEIDKIIELATLHDAGDTSEEMQVDLLTAIADLCCDLQVYAQSEMRKFGLPIADTMQIVMDSNFSKLGEDGEPIYNSEGKFEKGPNYWQPEERIADFIRQYRALVGAQA